MQNKMKARTNIIKIDLNKELAKNVIRGNGPETVEETLRNTNVVDFIKGKRPDDMVADSLNQETTLYDVLETLRTGGDVYATLGGEADSITREDVFTELSEVMDLPYDIFYNMWLGKPEELNCAGFTEAEDLAVSSHKRL